MNPVLYGSVRFPLNSLKTQAYSNATSLTHGVAGVIMYYIPAVFDKNMRKKLEKIKPGIEKTWCLFMANVIVNVKVNLKQATKTQRRSRGTALLFL